MSYLPNRGFESLLNSTTTLLTAGSTFTGVWELVTSYSSVMLAVKTDQNGAALMDFSPDGVYVDSTLTYEVSAGIPDIHRLSVGRAYYRVRFTNTSASDQTYLRLQTIYGNQTALSAPANLTIQQDADATIVRPTNYHYEVALGKWNNNTTWNKWGYNADIDTTTATVWSKQGLFTRLTSASGVTVVSTDVNDTAGGTGAQSIIIYAIDENFLTKIFVVTLNGTTPVVVPTGTATILGINRAAIYLAGSSGQNAGTIGITATTGGTTQAEIPVGAGSTQHAFFFVQADHTALMDWIYINMVKTSGGGKPTITTKCWVTSLVSGAKYEVFRDYIDVAVENHAELRPSQPFVVGEKSLIEFQATTDTVNTAISVRFSLIEVKTV
jgi:hypothetical protein